MSDSGRTRIHLEDDLAVPWRDYPVAMAWRHRVDLQLVDLALAAAVVLATTLSFGATVGAAGATSPIRWVMTVAIALPLLARRRAPEAVLITIAAGAVAQGLVLREMPGFGAFLALLIGAFSVGAHSRLSTGLAAMALCLAAVVIVGAAFEPLSAEGVVIPFVYLGAAWGIGRLVGVRTARVALLASSTERLVREQAARERAILVEERARISRELHDVVAHAVTTIVLQAGAAQAEIGPGEARLRPRLATIEATGRQALDELRRVLSVMRDPDATGVQDPMPGISDLPALIERTSESGLAVDLSVDIASELPPGLSLSIYRIVQESLTNALRHASATRARVSVREAERAITIEVSDDGRGAGAATPTGGSGRGLIGMRERAALFGGSLDARPDAQGGFRVRVRLPLREAIA